MNLCANCVHNTGLDTDLIATLGEKGQKWIPPNCEVNVPQYPHAETCTHHYPLPIDGD